MEVDEDEKGDPRDGDQFRAWRVNAYDECTAGPSNRNQAFGDFKVIKVPPLSSVGDSHAHRDADFENMEEAGNRLEFIKALHDAYEAAKEQQNQERQEMSSLQEVISLLTNHNEDDVRHGLENNYSQTDGGESVAGALAKFFHQQLQILMSQHELRLQDLRSNLHNWIKRCDELQAQIEKRGTSDTFSKEKADCASEVKDLVENFHNQLNAKAVKLQKLDNVVRQLESKIASLSRKDHVESCLRSGHEQTRLQFKLLEEQVGVLKQQKQEFLSEVSRYRDLKEEYGSQISEMKQELQRERDRIQKLARQLAKYRKQERESAKKANDSSLSSSPSSSSGDSRSELQNHVKRLTEKLRDVETQMKSMREKKAMSEVKQIEKVFLQTLAPDSKQQSSAETSTESGSGSGNASSDQSSTPSELREIKRQYQAEKTAGEGRKMHRKAELLENKLEQYKEQLKGSELKRRSFEDTIGSLNNEIKKLKQLSPFHRKDAPGESEKVKQLVCTLDEVEAENRELRRFIAVEKEDQIAELQKEIRKLRTLQQPPEVREDSSVHELEKLIAEKDHIILELRFDQDQARKRVAEVESKFDILFSGWMQERSKKLTASKKPLFGTLPRCPTKDRPAATDDASNQNQNTSSRGGSDNENHGTRQADELQVLVHTMKRVIENLREENARLKKAGTSEHRYQNLLKKNKDLKSKIDVLTFKITSYGNASPHQKVPELEKEVEELSADIQTLTHVNAELIQVVSQAEQVYPELKDKIPSKSGSPVKGALSFQYFADQSRNKKVLSRQNKELQRVQEELDKRTQECNDLMYQVAKREDELDLLYGKLYVKKVAERDRVHKQIDAARDPKPLKSHSTTIIDNGCFEEMRGDVSASPADRPAAKFQPYDLGLVDEIEDLRLRHERLLEIHWHYEQLLLKYTKELQIQFTPLRL